MKLRDYQEASVAAIFRYFEEGGTGNPLVALPTGTGKSLVIDEFMHQAFTMYPGQRFMVLTHVKELIEQNHRTLLRVWPTAPAGVYSAGLGVKDSHFPITFAGIQSVVQCPEAFGRIDLVLIDEAHLVSPKDGTMYQKVIAYWKELNPKLKVIGFTATHYRLGQGLLTETDGLFTDICFDMTQLEAFNWLLEQGYLSPLIPRRTSNELNVDAVHIHGGEYVQKELQAAVDRADVTYATLRECLELGQDRDHWLVFASGIQHAVHVTDTLEALGVSATCVHSKLPGYERDARINDYKAGRFRVMVNNGILTTGFDFPAIDLIAMLRPTQSTGLWVQMLGRGTRPVYADGFDLTTAVGRHSAMAAGPKRNCLVLDFAGNTRRLGPINDPCIPKRKGKGNGIAPVKVCEACGTYNHASVRFCINCGFEFHRELKITQGASTQELIVDSMPLVERFEVQRVTYHQHVKKDRPTSIRVSYFCGLRMFEEWVCLEHEGFARKKARDWWRARQLDPSWEPPETVELAMQHMDVLKVPKAISVWVNKKHPEIMSYEYES